MRKLYYLLALLALSALDGGSLTSSTSGTVTFTLTWSNAFAYSHGTRCGFSDLTTPADAINQTAFTTTTATFTGTTVSGDTLLYSCGPGY